MAARHNCDIDGAGRRGMWLICVECNGRVHKPGCTARRVARRDCCVSRHIEQGLSPDSAQQSSEPGYPGRGA